MWERAYRVAERIVDMLPDGVSVEEYSAPVIPFSEDDRKELVRKIAELFVEKS